MPPFVLLRFFVVIFFLSPRRQGWESKEFNLLSNQANTVISESVFFVNRIYKFLDS
jgi:hypothetical protein